MKRLLSILLCLALLAALCPVSHAAYSTSDDQPSPGPFLYVIPNFQASVLYAYFINSSGVSTVPWPGEMMRRVGDTYEVVLPPDTVGVVIQSGDAGFVYQSGRLDVMPNVDVWISVSTGGQVISYDGPAELPTPTVPTEPTIRMRSLSVKASGQVNTLHVYSEDDRGNKPFGNYPGALLSQQDGWYQISIPADLDMLILVRNSQSTEPGLAPGQSDQLWLQPDQDVWITLAADLSTVIRYGSPDNEPTKPSATLDSQGTPSVYRVVGNMHFLGNWDPANDQGIMAEVSPGVYKKTFENVPPGDYQILITKDGRWDQYWGQNGSNFCFTVEHTCTLFVTFTLENGNGVISVKGSGWFGDDPGDEPDATEPIEPPPTEPLPTEPIEDATAPTDTGAEKEPTVPTDSEDPVVSSSPDSLHMLPTEPTVPGEAAPDVNEPADADSAQVSPLVNLPIYSLLLFFIGMVCVGLYLLFLVRKRKKEQAAMILGGTVVQAGSLSEKATEDLVKDNPVVPPAELDEAVMNAIKDIEEKQ